MKKASDHSHHTFFRGFYGNFILLRYGQGIGTACQPETNLRIKLAGMDLLVLRTHWFRVHGPALY